MTRMTVNGEAIRYTLDPATPLLWALRDASNLTGTKYGCDDGRCGACTVIADGRALKSCRVSIAQMEGADITTIERLAAGRAHPLVRAFEAELAAGCGRCAPGWLMSAAALLAASPAPSAEAIDRIAPACACGMQGRMRRAIERAARDMAPAAARAQGAGDGDGAGAGARAPAGAGAPGAPDAPGAAAAPDGAPFTPRSSGGA